MIESRNEDGQDVNLLVIGTVAIDQIGAVDGAIGARNVKIQSIQTQRGGCGGNIAYNLALLDQPHTLFAYAGNDFQTYREALAQFDQRRLLLQERTDQTTARCYVFTDHHGEQFTAFQPLQVSDDEYEAALLRALADAPPSLAIIAPDEPTKMSIALASMPQATTVLWAPGQYTELMDPDTRLRLGQLADWIVVNSAELDSWPDAPRERCVVTDGARAVRHADQRFDVPPQTAIDPTGCGDAFTAAFAAMIARDQPIEDAIAQGIAFAGCCLLEHGAQNHRAPMS